VTFGFWGLTFCLFSSVFIQIDLLDNSKKVCVRARFTREATCFKTNIIITHHRMKQQELCEKTTSESCPQRRTNLLDLVKSTRQDLKHLREYALKVVRFVTLRLPFFSYFSGNQNKFLTVSHSNTGTKLILVEPVPQCISTLAGGHSQNSNEYL
jgi:hypothetical protein